MKNATKIIAKCILNTTPCQFTESKTHNGMSYIETIYLSNCNFERQHGEHHITIILTNKSLLETSAWRYRLNDRLGNFLRVKVLSSKKTSDFNNISSIQRNMLNSKKPDDLYDVLVMCSHRRRLEDILELIDITNNHKINLTSIGIHRITYTIMFDEADKPETSTYIADFLGHTHLIEADDEKSLYVKDIHFITATPYEQFWKKLNTVGITELTSIKKYLNNETSVYRSFDEVLKNYRKIKDHNINFVENMTYNTVEYASIILEKINFELYTRTIYAPANNTCISHDEMEELLLSYNCDVLKINGKHKAFTFARRNPDNKDTIITVKDFNSIHNIQGELRDTLRKYRELYPNHHLGITGNICIERGVTFNTDGFNFTDSIISNEHGKKIASLIQFLGRSNGHNTYVTKHNIWIPQSIYSKAKERINKLIDISKCNPEKFVETDFRELTRKEKHMKAFTVPIFIKIEDCEYDLIIQQKNRKKHNTELIKQVISKYNSELCFDEHVQDQISEPHTDSSYKKNITALEHNSTNNTKFSIAIKRKNKLKNVYQIWLDYKNKNIYISFYNGDKIDNL